MQNEPVLWDSSVNSTEEETEIAWKRIAASDIGTAAPTLANISEVHATTSTSSSAILT